MPASDLRNLTRREIAVLRAEPGDCLAKYGRGLGRVESRPDVLGGGACLQGHAPVGSTYRRMVRAGVRNWKSVAIIHSFFRTM
jgi:hypothetical protein